MLRASFSLLVFLRAILLFPTCLVVASFANLKAVETMSSSEQIPATMKAIVIRDLGDADVLKYEVDYPTPDKLEPGHVLVKNTYSGLNFIDTYFRKGLYPKPTPFIAGQEGGGQVVRVSAEAQAAGIQVGQQVAYMAPGSYAEYTAVPVSKVIPLPDFLSLDVAVACLTQGLTAHYLTTSAHANLIQPGEWCLIYAVGSGTCQWAAQMAKLQGYKVIGTTSKTKEDVARSLNCCDELIVLDVVPGKSHADYHSVDICAKVNEITKNKGVQCVIDGVGLSTYEISLNCLAVRGIFISFGNASGAVPAFPVLRLNVKSNFVTRPKLNDYTADQDELRQRCDQVFGWIQQGKLKITIDTIFPLDKAAEGHKYLESGQSKGKVLYKVS